MHCLLKFIWRVKLWASAKTRVGFYIEWLFLLLSDCNWHLERVYKHYWNSIISSPTEILAAVMKLLSEDRRIDRQIWRSWDVQFETWNHLLSSSSHRCWELLFSPWFPTVEFRSVNCVVKTRWPTNTTFFFIFEFPCITNL